MSNWILPSMLMSLVSRVPRALELKVDCLILLIEFFSLLNLAKLVICRH